MSGGRAHSRDRKHWRSRQHGFDRVATAAGHPRRQVLPARVVLLARRPPWTCLGFESSDHGSGWSNGAVGVHYAPLDGAAGRRPRRTNSLSLPHGPLCSWQSGHGQAHSLLLPHPVRLSCQLAAKHAICPSQLLCSLAAAAHASPCPPGLPGRRGRAEPIKLALAAKGIEFDVQPVGASTVPGQPASSRAGMLHRCKAAMRPGTPLQLSTCCATCWSVCPKAGVYTHQQPLSQCRL